MPLFNSHGDWTREGQEASEAIAPILQRLFTEVGRSFDLNPREIGILIASEAETYACLEMLESQMMRYAARKARPKPTPPVIYLTYVPPC